MSAKLYDWHEIHNIITTAITLGYRVRSSLWWRLKSWFNLHLAGLGDLRLSLWWEISPGLACRPFRTHERLDWKVCGWGGQYGRPMMAPYEYDYPCIPRSDWRIWAVGPGRAKYGYDGWLAAGLLTRCWALGSSGHTTVPLTVHRATELRLWPPGTTATTRPGPVIGSYFPVVYCYDMRSMCGQSTPCGPCHMTAASCRALRGDDQGGQADIA